jgi:hypothetical protein
MLHVDIPSKSEFSHLAVRRADTCVSIYLNTTPVTQDVQASRIEMKNLVREAQTQLEEAEFDKKRLAVLLEGLNETLGDDGFWRFQAKGDDANTNGGIVVGVRREDVPGGKELAAILRYSL